ncbi:MAG: thioredoxin family protein, partial [bacterium]|nr:thioredoxin family protein [bacterium]
LFLGPELEQPLLLNPGEKAIQTFPPAVMVKLSEEEYQLPSEIDLELVSKYRFEDLQVIFMLGEQETRLKRKPALLGFHDADKLQELRPKYRRRAADYTPAPEPLAALLKHPVEVKVLTYFGTWCPICSRLVPRLLRLDAELKGSNFRFEFFGLPQPPEIENDPVAQRENIKSLPTAVVSVDQKEIGRLGIRELHRPEVALLQLLTAGD